LFLKMDEEWLDGTSLQQPLECKFLQWFWTNCGDSKWHSALCGWPRTKDRHTQMEEWVDCSLMGSRISILGLGEEPQGRRPACPAPNLFITQLKQTFSSRLNQKPTFAKLKSCKVPIESLQLPCSGETESQRNSWLGSSDLPNSASGVAGQQVYHMPGYILMFK
jgi:hypothetical protein